MIYYVYEISRPKNTNDQRRYIGVTCSLQRRWKEHKKSKYYIGFFIRKYPDAQMIVLKSFNNYNCALSFEKDLVPDDHLKRIELKLINETGGGGAPPIMYGNKFAKGNKITELGKKQRSEKMKNIAKTRTKEHYMKAVRTKKENIILKGVARKYKTYWYTTPDNEIIEIANLKEYCLKNSLNYPSMVEVHKGTRKKHKGYFKFF